MAHIIIVIALIAVIVYFQFKVTKDTLHNLDVFKSIFPKSISCYSIEESLFHDKNEEENEEEKSETEDINEDQSTFIVNQIHSSYANLILSQIIWAINMYLRKNKGAASDFLLIKDVVERYCDAKEEEITTQQPVPLYLGLTGTIIGIIFGIIYIALSGGSSGEQLMDNIFELMGAVAIAMFASFCGIVMTIWISHKSKEANTEVEAGKNLFYSWLQSELLPTLSGNATNALYLLQQNLMSFNETFATNVSQLNSSLSQIRDTSAQQVKFLNAVEKINVTKIAKANISVLQELQQSTEVISQLTVGLHDTSAYLKSVEGLNAQINEYMTRTQAIENMGLFFQQEIEQVKTREQYINEVVANVDDTLRKTFEKLAEETKERISILQNNSVQDSEKLQKYYVEQREAFQKLIETQKEELSTHPDDLSNLVVETRKLSGIQKSMSELLDVSKTQSALLEKLTKLYSENLHPQNKVIEEREQRQVPVQLPLYVHIFAVVMALVMIVTCGIYIYNSFWGS